MDSSGTTPTVYKYKTEKDYAHEAAAAIEKIMVDALSKKPTIRVALSGGNSPLPVYRELAKSTEIKWHRVSLFLVDERIVPLKSNDSNYKNIAETLTDHLKNLRAFYYLNTREPIAKLVHQYGRLLEQQDSPLFDLVILGLGEDGHTASLFPHSQALYESRQLALQTVNPHHHASDRISMTFPALLNSDQVIFLVQGKSKAHVVDDFMAGRGTIDELPVLKMREHSHVRVYVQES